MGMETGYYSPVNRIPAFVRAEHANIVALIRRMVQCESPSDEPRAVNRFVDLLASEVAPFGTVQTFPGGNFGRHLLCEFALPGPAKKKGEILALGHSDTVWPMGTLARMPFRQADGRLWGPGVLDMKSGIAFFIYAMRALRELEIPVRSRVKLLINSDEEVGSDSSRVLTQETARRAKAVLVLEPGTGLEGKLKTARKGVGAYTITVRGRASHAGVDFTAGASAIVELARQIERVAAFTNVKQGITVNPGLISGGSRSNVVAAEARAVVDIRAPRLRDAETLDRKFRTLKTFDKRCQIEIAGGLNRPPMERSLAIVQLFRTAQQLAGELGVTLEESMTGGGSDGNFTAALGIPTLDGLGGVGEGAHALNESVLIDRIADRTVLLAKLVATL
jgi:glutamate carboxypeptidase